MQPVQTTPPMRTVGAPAGEMTLPSVETAVHVPAGAAPAAVATINVQPAPPGGQLTAGGGQVEVARRAGTRAKSPVAMTTPAQRAAPPSDRRAPESLDSLIDDRR
jgi:hypothetical protein